MILLVKTQAWLARRVTPQMGNSRWVLTLEFDTGAEETHFMVEQQVWSIRCSCL